MTTADPEINAAELRRRDPDRWLTCLFAPADRRPVLFAIYAFNLEVAKTREVVTEPVLGRIRLQWWRDAIDELYRGTPRRHPVLDVLAPAVARYGLDRAAFDTVIDAREADLSDTPPATLADLEAYAAATASPLLQLHLETLGAATPPALAAAHAIGIAWALVGLMRAIPFHTRARRRCLPDDLVAGAGVRLGDLFELRPHPELARAVERVCTAAAAHLARARSLRPEVPRTAVPALLSARLADGYLGTLRRAGFDPFDPRVQRRSPWRAIDLLIGSMTGRF